MLTTKNVKLSFGGVKAVNDVSVTIKPGQITALIGPNGAGKTTFFNCISAAQKIDSGEIYFEDKNRIDEMRGYQVSKVGISRTYQVINLFEKMSVIGNVLVGMHPHLDSNFWHSMLRTKKQRQEEAAALDRAHELLRFAGLEDVANDQAGSLAYGQQRLLEIVRALASNPKLILLDEPAAGMNATEKKELDTLFREIIDMGVTIFMIEHDMNLVMGVADEVLVLNYGQIIAQGTPAQSLVPRMIW